MDQDGTALAMLVHRWRDKHAAKTFFRKLLKGCQYVSRGLITDRLKSHGAAKRDILPSVEHRQHLLYPIPVRPHEASRSMDLTDHCENALVGVAAEEIPFRPLASLTDASVLQ